MTADEARWMSRLSWAPAGREPDKLDVVSHAQEFAWPGLINNIKAAARRIIARH